jgi:hypothetical protein
VSATRVGWTFGWFSRNRDLCLRPFDFSRVITAFNGAEVEKGVLFLGLVGKACRSALLAPKTHFDVMIRANWKSGFDALAAKNDVENPVHMRLQFGIWQLDRTQALLSRRPLKPSTAGSIRKKLG